MLLPNTAEAARFASVTATPVTFSIPGIPYPIIPIRDTGVTDTTRGVATISVSPATKGLIQFRVAGANASFEIDGAPQPATGNVAIQANQLATVRVAVGLQNLSRNGTSGNPVSAEFRTSANATPDPVTTHIVYVDSQPPRAPTGIRADGADGAILVSWDAPARQTSTGLEIIEEHIVYISDVPFAGLDDVTAAKQPSQRFPAQGLESFQERIRGLQNGKTYYVTVRAVDWVGLTSDFPRDSNGQIFSVAAEPVTTVSLAELAGEKGGCFIATAAYGSFEEPHVQVFRQFRDRILAKHAWGQAFIHWYYATSPRYASSIARHEEARLVARITLLPAFVFAYALLHPTLLWLAAGLLTVAWIIAVRLRHIARENAG